MRSMLVEAAAAWFWHAAVIASAWFSAATALLSSVRSTSAPSHAVCSQVTICASCRFVMCAVPRCALQVPPEVSAVVSQLQRVQPRMMADTVAMAEALEGLTVTRWEAWAGLLVELSLETNRKLLSLRVSWAG